jgi:acetylornithine deacetylase
MDQHTEKVLSTIDDLYGEMVRFLAELVRHPSTLGEERPAQEVVYRKLKSMGLSAELWEPRLSELSAHRAFAPVEWDYQNRPNLTAVLKGLGGGKSLAFNGHIDVVSPEPIWGWSHDPWGAEVEGNRMYGRGTVDMKGGIAMMVLALEGLIKNGVKLKGDIYLETVIEEECGGNGALACRLRGYAAKADAAIVTEGTGLSVGVSELGVMWFRVRLRSGSAHVAQAHKCINVIESCYPLMQALHRLEAEMNRDVTHPNYLNQEHPINLNVGEIKGGHWPSSVPVECSFVCRLSYVPGVSNQEMRKRVETCILEASTENPLFKQYPPRVEFYGFQSEGDWIEQDHQLIKTLEQAHKTISGTNLLPLIFTGTTDMRSFNLYTSTTAVNYGPKGENGHTSEEYVDLDSIVNGAKTLALFVMDWCGVVHQ